MSDEPRTVEGFLLICPGVPGVACDLRKGHTGEHKSWIGGSPVSPDEPRPFTVAPPVYEVLRQVLAEVARQDAGSGIDGDACSHYEGQIANAAYYIREAMRLARESAP